MLLTITDEFDLAKIADSGQCFRAKRLPNDSYFWITGRHTLTLTPAEEQHVGGKANTQNNQCSCFKADCTKSQWEEIWMPYFDLGRDYHTLRKSICCTNSYLERVIQAGNGIRILRQDPWETLITFILSQRKSIPAIRQSVEKLCQALGQPLRVGQGFIYTFPTAQAIAQAPDSLLAACSLGYRLPYVKDAARQVLNMNKAGLSLNMLQQLDDDALRNRLLEIHGVGIKVASCVALFAYGRFGCAPVDVWIARMIDENCNGCSPFPHQKELAGLLQQYMFYDAKHQPVAAR